MPKARRHSSRRRTLFVGNWPHTLQDPQASERVKRLEDSKMGQLITDEINQDPGEVERLRQSRESARMGRRRSLRDGKV